MSSVHEIPEGFELISPKDPYSESFGPVYVARAEQRMGFRVADFHCNPIHTLHGGALATFADMLISALPEYTGKGDGHAPTISLAIDYLAPALEGNWVEAEVSVDRITRRLLFIRSVISAEQRIVARTHAIYRNHEKTGYTLT